MLPLVLLTTTIVSVGQVQSYNHIETPYYKVILTSSYEDNLVGVHLKNKEEQDAAMQEFQVREYLPPQVLPQEQELEQMACPHPSR